MSKKIGCPKDYIQYKGKCIPVPHNNKSLHEDLVQASNCYTALAFLKDFREINTAVDDSNFNNIVDFTIDACLNNNEKSNIKLPIHFKSGDLVAKHAKLSKHKGILPNNHRGDFIKIRNGHGTLTMFSSS